MVKLQELHKNLSSQLASNKTTLSNCVDAAKVCLELSAALYAITGNANDMQQLEDLKEKFSSFTKMKQTHVDGLDDQQQLYSRYCCIQMLYSIEKLQTLAG